MERAFDSVVIDESKSAEERMRIIREMYIAKAEWRLKLKQDVESIESQYRDMVSRTGAALNALTVMREQSKIALVTNSQLEDECRATRSANGKMVEELKEIEAEDSTKRSEIKDNFEKSIQDIKNKMEDQEKDAKEQKEDNDKLAEQLIEIKSQYQNREKEYASRVEAKELQLKAILERLKRQEKLYEHELLKERAFKQNVSILEKTQRNLREQATIYASKFSDFDEAISKSNNFVSQLQSSLDEMINNHGRLEEEHSNLKRACNGLDAEFIRLLHEKAALADQVRREEKEKRRQEDDCRAKQAMRAQMVQEVKEARERLSSKGLDPDSLLKEMEALALAANTNTNGNGNGSNSNTTSENENGTDASTTSTNTNANSSNDSASTLDN